MSNRLPSSERPAPLTIGKILAWADAYYRRTGSWPISRRGAVQDAPGETWWRVNESLLRGCRGLPGGDSLPRLLARERGHCNRRSQPPLSVTQILTWADAYQRRTGRWPTAAAGAVQEVPGLTWNAINAALDSGCRGLLGGDSLARLLARRRDRSSYHQKPRLSIGRVLAWARAYRARRGCWPTASSGEVAELPGTTWMAVNIALSQGLRGLPGGTSLSRLVREYQGSRGERTA